MGVGFTSVNHFNDSSALGGSQKAKQTVCN